MCVIFVYCDFLKRCDPCSHVAYGMFMSCEQPGLQGFTRIKQRLEGNKQIVSFRHLTASPIFLAGVQCFKQLMYKSHLNIGCKAADEGLT